ncbi:hypothetical protein FHX42_000227 [Saccharopolyspora lacisalsi]|uniref:DUF2961 domain-containing protein n=1 Tax=Halosaccharopolyspora lacisalsi TaxID=1000566 RepID=A0A839DVS2_9PSEU|nr:glycoside hydrolase family 172 protein [Halosaccharopolyspora lacisalsi]MBA8822898.1 hypothetical protein [Halosaccharopolyspora lacisalsi]
MAAGWRLFRRVAGRSRGVTAHFGVLALTSAALVTPAGVATPAHAEPDSADGGAVSERTVGWETYRQLDELTRSRGSERTRQFSSFARDGSNDDGFAGTYSCLRTTSEGCVIAERAGAGEIASIWFTREPLGDVTATGNITVELDGKTVLDAPLSDVVSGRIGAPFVWPLVGNADDTEGGAVIKVPMPYRESMRITVDDNPYFYHVDHRVFPDAEDVSTFDPTDPASDVVRKLRRFGIDDPKPPAPTAEVAREDFSLEPGESEQLATLRGPASIDELRLRIPQVAASPRVVDDGRAFGAGGGSEFRAAVAPNNEGVRITRRFDPQIGHQTATMLVDGQPAGEWRSGPAVAGQWGTQNIEVPERMTEGKSSLRITNRFVSSELDFNEFRYEVHSLVDGEWVRTDVLNLGPTHPGEEQAHDYSITNQVFERDKLVSRYPTPPEKVAASDEVLRSTRLRITFDGHTTVDAPIGEFFGSGLGEYDVRRMMSSIDAGSGGWYTSWWPMPFNRTATVELVNTGDVPIERATLEAGSVPSERVGPGTGRGYFHATHKRGATVQGEDWNFLTARGSGTFYGVTHSMRGRIPPHGKERTTEPLSSRDHAMANIRNYLEGDERFYVNGSSSPSWHGTGSEDFYESGWYFRSGTTYSMPLAGNPAYERYGDGCKYDCTGAYRLMIPDAVPFSDGIVAGIEHGPSNNEPGLYSSTAYWYGGLPSGTERTDRIDLADRSSRAKHSYKAGGEKVETLTSTFVGLRDPEPLTRETTTASGRVGFEVDISESNNGVRLRRLSDQAQSHQKVRVRVDGKTVGTWLQPLGNRSHRWLQDGFDIPPAMTAGKSSIRVELVPVGNGPDWSASRYTVFSHK